MQKINPNKKNILMHEPESTAFELWVSFSHSTEEEHTAQIWVVTEGIYPLSFLITIVG